jgi:hypothetical protein
VAKFGNLWQIGFSWVSGAREDGDSLARDLLRKWRTDPAPKSYASPPPVNAPVPPATDYEAVIESLKAQLAEAQARPAFEPQGEPEPVKMPEFLKAAEPPPADIADLIDWSAPPKERQEALLVKLREVAGLIGLAEDRGGRATPDLYRKRDRLESGIHFNRPTLTETI